MHAGPILELDSKVVFAIKSTIVRVLAVFVIGSSFTTGRVPTEVKIGPGRDLACQGDNMPYTELHMLAVFYRRDDVNWYTVPVYQSDSATWRLTGGGSQFWVNLHCFSQRDWFDLR